MHHLGVEEHEPAAGRNDMQNLRRGVAVGVRILGPWAAGRRRAASEAWRAGGGRGEVVGGGAGGMRTWRMKKLNEEELKEE